MQSFRRARIPQYGRRVNSAKTEFTQHIRAKGAHLVRYYNWYSNKARGVRAKAAAEATASLPSPAGRGAGGEGVAPARVSQTWAMLIKRVYKVDPLACPRCGGAMRSSPSSSHRKGK